MDIPWKDTIPIFDHLTDDEFLEIRSVFTYRKYHKGDLIIQEGDVVKDLFFIHSGLVKLSYVDEEAKEFVLSFAFENWWETDFSAFYNGTKPVFRLQCLEDTETFCLSYEGYSVLINQYGLSNYFLDKSIRGHIASQRRILSLLTHNPKERYEQFLKLYPTLGQRIPKSVLALYLGVSRETLSRLYKHHKI